MQRIDRGKNVVQNTTMCSNNKQVYLSTKYSPWSLPPSDLF